MNIIAACSLLLGYISPYINPAVFWPIAFFGLALPFLLLINIIFMFIWIFWGNIRFLLPLFILILGYKSIPRYLQLRINPPKKIENSLKVMSFNVRVFDLYMWSKNKATRNKIFTFLEKEQPDILCLQEFYHSDVVNPDYEFKTLDTLVQFLKAKNYHSHYTTTKRNTDHWGLITFSRFPIEHKGVVPFMIEDDNACIYTDIKTDRQIIRVYNAHLASIKLNRHDYKAMEKINQNEYSGDFGDEKLLINKLRRGFIRRSFQADSIQKSISNSPYPVVVCGDFNDTPTSYAYQSIKSDLKDAFMEAGSGLGQTYIGEFPSFRIDYIFVSADLSVKQFTTHKAELSDHHPISSQLLLP